MSAEKKYQVFISSTYTDLIEERREVQKALLELNCIPVGMEMFPAADEDQWSYIQQIIEECDYYILIIAARYGSTTPEGISYTEKEFEYATKKGIPVISFVHRNPYSISADRFELNEDNRKKLDQFREKAQNKLCKMWETPAELGGVVSRSLVNLMRTKPAIGYVRADKVGNPEKLLEMNEKIQSLENEITKLRSSEPEGTEDLAKGDETFTIRFDFQESFGIDELKKDIQLSWNKIIALLGPSMFDENSEANLKLLLESFIKKSFSVEPQKCKIFREDFDTIILQLFALGITHKSEKKHTASDTAKYWSLTTYGERTVMQLKAVKTENRK